VSSWPEVTIGELCHVARGGSPRPIKKFLTHDADGINWVKIGDATAGDGRFIASTQEKIKPEGMKMSRLVKPGDFLLSNSMSFGRPYIMRTTGCIHDGWLVLTDKSNRFDPGYLYYFLSSDAAYRQFDALAAGSTVRNLNTDLVKTVKVTLPPLEEQRRIVAALDEAFAAIAIASTNAGKIRAEARLVFQAVAERIFTIEGANVGHGTVLLGSVCKLINGRAYAKEELLREGKTPVLRVGNFFTNPNWYYSDLKLHDDKYAGNGDLLYAWSASFGPRIWNGGRVIYHYHIWKMLPDEDRLDKRYLFHFLEWDKERIKGARGAGATMLHVTKASMEARSIALPTLSEQRRFADRLDAAADTVQELIALQGLKIDALEDLKQSLLHRAFSGDLAEREPLAA
jgi:type I restriction enzyme S subunit